MPSRGRTPHPGTRAQHRRRKPNGGTTAVRATSIKYPQAQQKRRQITRQMSSGRKAVLAGVAGLALWGAFEAVLAGRWGTAFLLFGAAGGLGLTHVAWSAHKRRQASRDAQQVKQPKPKPQGWQAPSIATAHYSGHRTRCDCPQCQQQRAQALEKAPAAHQPKPAPAPQTNGSHAEPASHAEWQARYGRRCDCPDCRAKRRAEGRMQTKMAEARRYAFSREGLREFWTGKSARPVEPAGTRRAPAKTGPYRPPPLSTDDSVEPIGDRSDPPKRAVQQADGTTANLYTPRRKAEKADLR